MKTATLFFFLCLTALSGLCPVLAGRVVRTSTIPPCPGGTADYIHYSDQNGTCNDISWVVRYYPAGGGYVDVPYSVISSNSKSQPTRIRVTWPAAVAGLTALVAANASRCCTFDTGIFTCPGDPTAAGGQLNENFFNPAITGITGNQYYNCNNSGTATFSVQNPVPGTTYTWSSSGSTGFQQNPLEGQGTATVKFSYSTVSGNATGTITVTATSPCSGYTTQTFSKSVYRQFPPSNITGNSCIPYGGGNNSRDFFAPEGINYQWSTTPAGQFAFIGSTTSSVATIYALNPSASGAILLTYTRPCDNQSVQVSLGIYASQYCSSSLASGAAESDSLLLVYPNPASGHFTVEYQGKEKKYRLSLYNAYNEPVKEKLVTGASHTVHVSDLPEGLYYLHVLTDKGIITRKRIAIKK